MPEIKLTKRQEETLLNRIWQDYEFGKREREKHITEWRDARKQFNSEWVLLRKSQADEDLDDHIYVPKTRINTARVLADLSEHFFAEGRRKLAKVLPPSEAGLLPIAASIADKVLHAKLDLAAQPEEVLPAAWEAAFVDGQGWVKVGWERGERVGADGTPYMVNRPKMEHIENDNIVHDPYARIGRDIGWVIHEKYLSEEEMWQRHRDRTYRNVKEVASGQNEATQDEWRKDVGGPGNKRRVLYKVLEFWGNVQIYTDAELEKMRRGGKYPEPIDVVATVYRNMQVLRVESNQYANLTDAPSPFDKLPFIKITPIPRRGTTYGDSFVTLQRPLQREINTLRNQRRIAVEAEMNPKVLYDRNRLTELDELYKAKYGGPVGVDGNPNDVAAVFKINSSTAGMAQEEVIMDADLRDLTGVNHYKMGGTAEGMQKTATGVTSMLNEGNVTMNKLIKNVGMTGILPLARFVMECCIEWVDAKETDAIVSGKYPDEVVGEQQQLPPSLKEMLPRDYSIELEAGPTASSRQMELGNIERALMMTGQMAQLMPQEAMATARVLIPQMLILLGKPEAAALFNPDGEQPPQQEGQQAGQPQVANQRMLSQQGRSPTIEEMPRR